MKLKNKNTITFIIILIVSLFVAIPSIKMNIQYDDGIQHVCRLIGTERSIKEGNIFSTIISNLCNNFGYSWNLFYSPLTAYLPLIFRIFGFSYGDCLRLFLLFCSIASGYSMYFFVKKILQKKDIDNDKKYYIALLAASFYICAPYRISDMYIRVAIAEVASFIFIPIIWNGIYSIFNYKEFTSRKYVLCFGIVGLMLSHTLITFYMAIICAIYVICNYKKIDKHVIIQLVKNILLALAITAFYWIPLVESKLLCDYEVFNQSHMVRENVLVKLKVSLIELIWLKDDRMAYFLEIPLLLGIMLTINIVKKKKIQDLQSYFFFLITGIICVILTMDFIPFEKFPSFMKMMQFSFRLLEFSSFFLSVIAAINIGLFFKEFTFAKILIIVLVIMDLIIPISKNIDYQNGYISENDLIQGVRVTSSTGRVHAGCASFEYLPSKAFNNRKYIEDREDVPIAYNNQTISNYEKNGLTMKFAMEGTGEVELPYIYYIGYCVRVNGVKVKTKESDNGFIKINVTEEKSSVTVDYEGSTLMKISLIISIISLLSIFVKKIIDLRQKKD